MKTEIDVTLPTLFKQLLSKQFERLSMLEKRVIYCLASHRQSVTLKKLQEYIKPPVYLSDLTQALVSLKRRSLIEVTSLSNKSAFTLQPLIMKYVFRESQQFFV